MDKDTFFRRKSTLNAGGKLINFDSPKVMGILNITPDSFYEASRFSLVDEVIPQAEKMLREGADFLDIGAYSSRPGAEHITEQEETDRLIPVVETLSKNFPDAVLSIDTFRSRVAELSIKAGAHIINDISGGQLDDNMFEVIARLQAPYILMHMQGNPKNMQENPQYENVAEEIYDYLYERCNMLRKLGVHDVIIDPGFGFGKSLQHNYELMRELDKFSYLQLPILIGISRKGMIYKVTGGTAETALNGTTALNTIALMKGANILRVHDVASAVETVKIFQQLHQQSEPC
jgi:dihydropteroate synthase